MTEQPGEQLTDPKFLSLMAFNHCMQMNDQYIYI